jgi:hypothetical protein
MLEVPNNHTSLSTACACKREAKLRAAHIMIGVFSGSTRRWEDNIKTDLQEVGWVGMDWIELAQDRDR